MMVVIDNEARQTGPAACWVFRMLSVFALSVLGGCANDENVRKVEKGFYQEGSARLSSDQQQAYVSFQKAVKLNPRTRTPITAGHIYASQTYRLKLAEGESFEGGYSHRWGLCGSQHLSRSSFGQPRSVEGRHRGLPSRRSAQTSIPTPDLARFHLGGLDA